MLNEQQVFDKLAKSGLIVNDFNDQYFVHVNGGTFNQSGSTLIYDDFYHGTLNQKKTLFIIIGTDSGLLPKYIYENCIAKEAHYLFIELEEVSTRLQECGYVFPQHKQFSYHTVSSWLNPCKQAPLIYYLYQQKCEVIQSMAVLDGFCTAYQTVRYEVERQAQHLMWTINMQLVGKSFVIQQLLNIAENQIPAGVLKNSFPGKTAIILAGGPSLDNNLDWIKQHRDKLFVAAVSRISKRLLEVDLIPDIVVSIDPTEKMLVVSKEMLNFPESVVLVNADHVTSQLLGAWPHRRVYLGKRLPWDDSDANNIPAQGPTVTNAALALLIEMGFSTILLTGADLCYSQEGYTHAKGSAEHNKGPLLGYFGQQVICYNGQTADTDAAFYQATIALQAQAEIARNAGCQLINLSETATKIDGISYQSQDDFVFTNETIAVEAVFKQKIPHMSQDWLCADYRKTLETLKQANKELVQCHRLIQECRELNKQGNTKLARYEKSEKKLNEKYQPWLAVLKRYHMAEFKDFFGQVHQDLNELTQIQAATESYLHAYHESCQALLELIQKAIAQLESRAAEWASKPDISHLILHWRKMKQLGRVKVWEYQHQACLTQLSATERQCLTDAQSDFATQLIISTPKRPDGFTLEQFKQIQSKCLFLYRSRDPIGLQALLGRLSRQSSDGAKSLQALCAGCLAELLESSEEAIDCYYSAADHPMVRELALNHLTSLLIKCHDNDNALLALECLCQISQGYCLSYANLLASTGQTASAIAVLERYLVHSSDDKQARATLEQLRKTH